MQKAVHVMAGAQRKNSVISDQVYYIRSDEVMQQGCDQSPHEFLAAGDHETLVRSPRTYHLANQPAAAAVRSDGFRLSAAASISGCAAEGRWDSNVRRSFINLPTASGEKCARM